MESGHEGMKVSRTTGMGLAASDEGMGRRSLRSKDHGYSTWIRWMSGVLELGTVLGKDP
jgi:hypothetical protein